MVEYTGKKMDTTYKFLSKYMKRKRGRGKHEYDNNNQLRVVGI